VEIHLDENFYFKVNDLKTQIRGILNDNEEIKLTQVSLKTIKTLK